ncbi:MAG: hypothetical protein H6600_02335 [Flavobacteriales bacterium]|nr:hypothetical protein [Flavobacteriales bacterium]
MKKLFILLVFNINLLYSQSSPINFSDVINLDCNHGRTRAISDYLNNQITYTTGSENTNYFFENYLTTTTPIKILHVGCIITHSDICYSNLMSILIKRKYGNIISELNIRSNLKFQHIIELKERMKYQIY